jgi:hypothetical protein
MIAAACVVHFLHQLLIIVLRIRHCIRIKPRGCGRNQRKVTGMSTFAAPPKPSGPPTRESAPELPDARVLEDKTPSWFRSTPASALSTFLIGIVFILMASRPLWHTDLWDHLNYGQNILATRSVSVTEPLLRLCRGVSMVNIPWLAQVGMASLNNRFGLTALQFVYALLIALSLAVIVWRGSKQSHSLIGGLLAAGLFFKVNLDQLLVIRPQLAGVLFYVIVASWSLGRRKHSMFSWIGMPLMFVLWANVHGSFSMGLFLLGLTAVGRFGDVLVISRSLKVALLDRELHRTLLLLQVCGIAVLLNPAGLAIYPEVLNVAGNPNIESMFEWDALTLRTAQGQSAAAVALLAFFAIKLSPRRMHCGEMLSFVVIGLMAAYSARMLNWWAPIAGLVTGTHLIAGMRRTAVWLKRRQPAKPSGLWTVVQAGLLWILFAMTPFGIQVLHGRVPDANRLVSPETPLSTVAYLDSMESIPNGICFIPAEWSGYVMNRGPKSLEPMVNLHVHVIPTQVWNDYIRLINGPSDWQSLMDEYGINLAVVDKNRQPGLHKNLKGSSDWTAKFEDRQGAVFVRKNPI